MPFSLKPGSLPEFSGKTLFSDNGQDPWLKPTGVYLPPNVDLSKGVVNVVVGCTGT
jgi:hypothetical protein